MSVQSLQVGSPPRRWWGFWRKGLRPAGQSRWDRSLRVLSFVVIFCFVGLAVRLFMLQWGSTETGLPPTPGVPQVLAPLWERYIPAPRGEIRDASGQVLAYNVPVHRLFVLPKLLPKTAADKKRLFDRLHTHLQWKRDRWDQLASKWQQALDRNTEEAEVGRLSPKEAILVEGDKQNLPGIRMGLTAERAYWTGPFLVAPVSAVHNKSKELKDLYYCGANHSEACLWSHVVGVVNQSSREEVEAQQFQPGELVGRMGIERMLDKELRGRAGIERGIPDGQGRTGSPSVRVSKQEAVPGNHVVLTLDLRMQRVLQQALRMYPNYPAKAAAVVEIATGRVLGMLSVPAVDPNVRLSEAAQKAIWADPSAPTKDKALREMYFPASTFKPVVALAAWQRAKQGRFHFNPNERPVNCTGHYEFRGQRFRCTGSHGRVDLHDALKRSCNVYFYHLAEQLGLDAIAETASQLGLGQPMHVGMGEAQGVMPTEEFYRNREGGIFKPGHALSAAIGQGEVQFSVAQMARAYAALFHGGIVYKPGFIERIESPDGHVVTQYEPVIDGQAYLPPGFSETVLSALRDVVQRPKGTAYEAIRKEFHQTIPEDLAGKTGTVQQVRRERRGEPSRNNAWFVGVYPSRQPKVALAVYVPEGIKGGEVAGPIAMRIAMGCAEYFGTPSTKGAR